MRAVFFTAAAAAVLALAACDQSADTADADAASGDAALAAVEAEAEAPVDAPAGDEPASAPAPTYVVPAGVPPHIAAAVASPDRTPQMTERDINRKPAETLTLARVEPGDRIAEFASFGNYYTTMLSAAVGPEGRIYMYDLPYTAERNQAPSEAFVAAHPNAEYHLVDYNQIELPADLDAVHIVLYYHDLPLNEVDTAALNAKIYDALKPGGIYFIVDHNAPSGSGTEYTQSAHRIDPAVIRSEVEAAGFALLEESDLLTNPDDDLTAMVFAPGERGHTSQSVFVFQKPE